MYRAALRTSSRTTRPTVVASSSRRFITTSPASKRRTWKGAAVRWGLAVAAVYWYNTSPIFADDIPPQTRPAPPTFSESEHATVDSILEEKRRQAAAAAAAEATAAAAPVPTRAATLKSDEDVPREAPPDRPATAAEPGSPEALEEEADQQGAFNPETGEINWDCPCLGGMAHGPCGEPFKAAFSCFVYSSQEPKGMDCIDKFQNMQDCFRQHPDVYGDDLVDLPDEEAEGAAAHPPSTSPEAKSTGLKDPTDKLDEGIEETDKGGPKEDDPQKNDQTSTKKVEGTVKQLQGGSQEPPAVDEPPRKAYHATNANKSKSKSKEQ